MALTTDERERLAAALAETNGAVEALVVLKAGAGELEMFRAVATVLLGQALVRADVPAPTHDELSEIARTLAMRLPEVQAVLPMLAACEAQGGRETQRVTHDLCLQLAHALVAKLGLTPPAVPRRGNPLAC